mmetsp:Transcript_18664/g.56412  ORF Transcript_18664/g.56412 Transcript_18664/m.56412 type:complete len:121 (+) Transcript_18664:361-723(+)|eukprot:CAMPEP_0206140676 /NCGR_PEP_ID=MMETSP1473-20131121/10289_1 /ASSEMBLY_ACC=CAM_ASM_001109 /TAXON_ID=1461547 /ORGANISM="Stichococcus sp, Strain RCC1054" /LENGTH=120 /DNA_ID=CAMNT_0053534913 /DNA_START=298 /DNA_END=660 /DNA_ORIENTATION=+
MSNAPDRFEKFTLPEGVKKITHEKDKKVPDAAKFVLEREDHTVGNLLRMQLHRDKNVMFAGYQVPHPLEYKLVIKVQTNGKHEPVNAMENCLKALEEEYGDIKQQFDAQAEQLKSQMPHY